MGCSVREKHIRANRRARSAKTDPDHSTSSNANSANSEKAEDCNKAAVLSQNYHSTPNSVNQNPSGVSHSDPTSISPFDDNGWGYCTEEQLEDFLMKNMDFLYNEAMNKLVGLGYDEEVAMRAILRNGHCYGGMDVLTNILHNALAYLNNGGNSEEESEVVFSNVKQLEEYSLAGMICLLQQVRPQLSRGDAMWCLLMSDLHVGRASVMEIPSLQSPTEGGNGNESSSASGGGNSEAVVSNAGPVGVAPALCRFHGGWGFGNSGTSEFPTSGTSTGFFSNAPEIPLQREIECPKRFNLTPSMKNLLKKNVAMFAAGFRANAKQLNGQTQGCPKSLSSATVSIEESEFVKNQDVVNAVMGKFQDLNLDENPDQTSLLDQKDELILSLVHQIKDLEKQVKERKEWAHQKAMQAARKLSNDLTELKMLRMEREETQRLRIGKQELESSTMKRLGEMENALRIASGQVDRANGVVRKLEIENAEIKAEMEASKLSASESVATCLEVAKREKKHLKKLMAWEKQKSKLQEDIAAEKLRILEMQQELVQVEAETKEAEAKWREEQKAKEQALVQLEEERRLKETAEANNKRKIETLRLKIEIDFQRHKDDLQRLEQEYSRLKDTVQANKAENESNEVWTGNSKSANPEGDTIARLLRELDQLEDSQGKEIGHDRECMICLKDEVSVVFLPCTHQVICANCNDSYGKKGKALCPYCRVPIEQRIRVYGASS